jgi:uncharacterized glyoxalase superfamily protein PhnB
VSETRIVDVNPVIPAKDMEESLAFYEGELGFTRTFQYAEEPGGPISYAGIRRGGLGLHLQAMVPGQDDAMPLIRIRVENIEPLYHEFVAAGVVSARGHLEPKPWGSRDFGVYDPSGAALVFYEDL